LPPNRQHLLRTAKARVARAKPIVQPCLARGRGKGRMPLTDHYDSTPPNLFRYPVDLSEVLSAARSSKRSIELGRPAQSEAPAMVDRN
jgi:hypothetical protein